MTNFFAPTADDQQFDRLTAELAATRAELRDTRERAARLDSRLLDLQLANETAYEAEYKTAGGPSFDKMQPFGELSLTPYGPPRGSSPYA